MRTLFTLLALLFQFSVFGAVLYQNIDGVYYLLDEDSGTAAVTCRGYDIDGEDGWMYFQASQLYQGDVVIPSSVSYGGVDYAVTSIGNYAFAGSSGMTSLRIPSSVVSIGYSIASLCNSLASYSVDAENPSFFSYDGVLYSRSPLALLLSPRAKSGVVTVYDGITELPSSAFQYCSYISSVKIPSSVKSIKDGAFANCTSLAAVALPSGVKSIGNRAFFMCESLSEITIPSSVETIDDNAFYGCASLATVRNCSSLPISAGESGFGSVALYASEVLPCVSTSVADESAVRVYSSGSGVVVDGGEGLRVRVFGYDGTLVHSGMVIGRRLELPLASGVYLVRVGDVSFKIVLGN
ncbi:MAG: leucine-rich repeat domain-containing protein [Paludibacteraceae bacterium]|nr:leucine-rich repeat domain-containing protein [Paludibacteraceae bacterium]MBQ7748242.1 leucine-rich repeat domain-containing protein [Paludibacteraceae bacterium]MBR0498247.1 leucine-rich repeat domain-containing protein [Paludibacteraceae bacterium]